MDRTELPIVMERKSYRDRDNEDRISNLPEFLIHQILSYLSPEEAAQTSVLSKTWLQSYSTSPILTFDESLFVRSTEIVENRYPFFNFVNKTLLRYTRLNLRIQKLVITVFGVDHEPAYRLLLDDSLGFAFDNGVQELNISSRFVSPNLFSAYILPSAMLQSAKLLTYLMVDQCKFPENIVSNSKCNAINFPFLKTLILYHSYINDRMLQKLLSGSPSIEKIIFFRVFGFKKFRVTKLGKLRSLDITTDKAIVIDVDDAPSLDLLTCWGCSGSGPCLLKVGSSSQSLNLKRLGLYSVSISDNSLKDFITKSPLLQHLRIRACNELERVYILSSSLKYLDIQRCKMLVEARIDAPNLLELCYNGKNMSSLSLTNTPDELEIFISIDHFDSDHLNNAWFNQLRQLLKAVIQARVYFSIFSPDEDIEFGIAHDSRENPLPLEYQHQTENFMPHINQSSSMFATFVETLFSSSRPATIDTPGLFMSNYAEFVMFLSNELMTTTRNPDCCSFDQTKCWRHYLKDIKVEVYEDSQEVWQPLLPEISLSEFTFGGQDIRFSLKWYANLNVEV